MLPLKRQRQDRKRFAVVATEIGKLAQTSADSVSSLISEVQMSSGRPIPVRIVYSIIQSWLETAVRTFDRIILRNQMN